MVAHTRLDCIIGSAALMRPCAQLEAHHCSQREAFGKELIEKPLMRAVLSDLALESESAMFMWLRLAAALHRAGMAMKTEQRLSVLQQPSLNTGSAREPQVWRTR